MLTCTNRASRRSCGLSLVELMVGLVIGLIVTLGASSLVALVQTGSWRLLIETRLNQDLRAATDVVARDLRRSGYWGNAISGSQALGSSGVAAQNPYIAVSGSSSAGLSYGFSRDAVENNLLDDVEQFGFRLSSGVLQMQTASGVWQDLTDDKSLRATAFNITPSETTLALGHLCSSVCAAGTPNCPTTKVRSYAIALTAQAVRDAAVVRTMNLAVRVRSDQQQGRCPA